MGPSIMRMEPGINRENPSSGQTTSLLPAGCHEWDAERDDTGHKTCQSPGFDNHGRIKGKTMVKREKHWKCKYMAVKPSD